MLGNTLGVSDNGNFTKVNMTAFGETTATNHYPLTTNHFFTGKPYIGELGYAFLFRNYRPEQGKWQTADPLGYPDGWNNLAYVNNGVTGAIDWQGTSKKRFDESYNSYTQGQTWSTYEAADAAGLSKELELYAIRLAEANAFRLPLKTGSLAKNRISYSYARSCAYLVNSMLARYLQNHASKLRICRFFISSQFLEIPFIKTVIESGGSASITYTYHSHTVSSHWELIWNWSYSYAAQAEITVTYFAE
ncbi:MAG: hypothetical protein LBM70_10140, partial [Victivallales bacterium]|jgi:RHS repeat-associated protein|nr:hypothetical protein [Victivallales bacterium]